MLLDGHSLAYRAFYALKDANLVTTDGQHTEAVYGFTSMLVNLLRDERPSNVAVCFDRSEPTFRHESYEAYKANRQETPEDFRGQMSLIFEMLDTLRIPRLSVPGFEADDLIATLATRAAEQGMEVLIVSGDRDNLQLVSDKVTVLMTRRGISDMTRFTPEEVEAKYGLTPAQYPDFAALRGDPSDNLPSIPGVGEKTAAKWVREFGSLDELVRRVDEVKGKAGERLREHLGQVIRNRQLTELRRDVPLDVEIADLKRGPFDREGVHKLLDTLQFRGELRDRLFKVLGTPDAEPAADGGFEVELTVLGPDEVAGWLAGLPEGRAGLAVQGSWGSGTGRIDALAIAAPGNTAAYLDMTTLTPADQEALHAWLCDESRPKAAHDAKGPLLALWAHGLDLRGLTCDTALAAYLALPGQASFPLEDLALRYLHRELRATTEPDGQAALFDDPTEDAAENLAVRARAICELADALEATWSRAAASGCCARWSCRCSGCSPRWSAPASPPTATTSLKLEAEFGAAVKQAVEEAHRVVGEQFNLGSTKQLQEILFVKLGLPKTKKIKTGYTTDADALAWLATQTDHELPVILLRHRDQTKLRTTVEGLIKEIGDDGRIHTTFNQTRAATGRLSSRSPTCRTSRSAPRRAAASGRASSWARATRRCSPPTTARSSCASWRTCPATSR